MSNEIDHWHLLLSQRVACTGYYDTVSHQLDLEDTAAHLKDTAAWAKNLQSTLRRQRAIREFTLVTLPSTLIIE